MGFIWFEYATVIGGAIVNVLLWFVLLPVMAAAVVAGITSIVFALAIAGWFNVLDRRRDTIEDTSDQ